MREAISSGGSSTEAVYRVVMSKVEAEDASGSILDFGAGKGAITGRLLETGRFSRIVAADLIEYDLPTEVEHVVADLNAPLSLPDSSFDVILALGVIESLENPFQAFREFRRLAKPGGLLIATTVNNESLRAVVSLVVRGYFPSFPARSFGRLPMVRATLDAAMVGAGFSSPRWFYSNYGPLPGPLRRLTWQGISLGLLRGLRFSNAVGFVSRSTANVEDARTT